MTPSSRPDIIFEHKGIGTVIAHNRLAVPLNQREYSWQAEHVTELLADFSNAIADNRATYFLGTIVLTSGSGDVPEVSDGQQRLATTTILLAAIRDYFFRSNDKARADAIEQTYLKTPDLVTTAVVPRLKLNVDDNEFFSKFVISAPDSSDRKIKVSKESHKNIAKAAELAARHIDTILAQYKGEAKTARLIEWVNFVKDGAQVIILRVPDDLNAFVMFETLNDRGLKASQADLVKNHVLRHAGSRITEAQQRWANMQGTLETAGEGDITVTFLHHLLITRRGPTREREVLDEIRRVVDSQSRAIEFLDELAESANDYVALLNPHHKKWNSYGSGARKALAAIRTDLRVEQIRPLMFAVARRFSQKEAIKAFRLFVFWSVRFLIVGGRGGLLDRNYATLAHAVATSKIKTAAALSHEADFLPSDAIFEASFAEARVSQGHLARYYLRALELKLQGDEEPEFVPNDEENSLNIEHILPENPHGLWSGIDPEIAAAHHKRIGNMVLVPAKKNSIMGNSPFAEKKKVLKDLVSKLSSDVAKHDTWGITEITERQQALAKLAVKTWPLKA